LVIENFEGNMKKNRQEIKKDSSVDLILERSLEIFQKIVNEKTVLPTFKQNLPFYLEYYEEAAESLFISRSTMMSMLIVNHPTEKTKGHLLGYKNGDSLFMKFSPVQISGDKFYLELRHMPLDFIEDKCPSTFQLSDLEVTLSEDKTSSESFLDTKRPIEISSIPVSENDVVVVGSDGFFDSFPRAPFPFLST
jgi:hypothetical protein